MENPQSIEVPHQQKALKKDFFDKSARAFDRTADTIQSEAMVVSSLLLSLTENAPGYVMAAVTASLAFGFLGGDLPKSFTATFLGGKNEKKETSEDVELGYRTRDLVYQSKEPLSRGNVTLQLGSNMLFVQLPELEGESGFRSTLRDQLYRKSLEAVKGRLNARPYDAVILSIPNPELEDAPDEQKITHGELLEGKKLHVATPDAVSVILKPEELENFSVTPSDTFRDIIAVIGDESISEIVELSKSATPEERERIQEMLNYQLQRLMKSQAEAYFNGSQIKLEKVNGVPIRERVDRRLEIQRTATGSEYLRHVAADGSIETSQLDRLLGIEGMSIEQILRDDSKYKKMRLIYVAQRMLFDTSIDQLTQKDLTVEELLTEIKKEELSIRSFKIENVLVSKGRHKRNLKQNALRRLRPFVAPAIIASTLIAAKPILEDPVGAHDLIFGQEQQQKQEEIRPAAERKPEVWNELPQHALIWKISPQNLPMEATQGYYLTHTAKSLDASGKWEFEQVVERKLDLPAGLTDDQSYILLERQEEKKHFTIPIKNNTELAALSIKDRHGNDVKYSATQFTDGTVVVDVEEDTPYVDIKAELIASQNGPRATGLTEKVDESQLGPEALELLQKTQQFLVDNPAYSEYDLPAILAYEVALKYKYAVLPQANIDLQSISDYEDIINRIAQSPVTNCLSANTIFVLLDALREGNASKVNMGFGFLHGADNNPASDKKSTFLKNETYHAFGINTDGYVIDATPPVLSDDPATLSYVDLLNKPDSGGSIENEWEKNNNAMEDKIKKEEEYLRKQEEYSEKVRHQRELGAEIIGALAIATAGFFASKKGYSFASENLTRENITQMREKSVLSAFSQKQLNELYGFFAHHAWSGGRPIASFEKGVRTFETKEDALLALRENIPFEMLDAYVEAPVHYEKDAGFSVADRVKARLLARYILG